MMVVMIRAVIPAMVSTSTMTAVITMPPAAGNQYTTARDEQSHEGQH